MEAEEPYRPGRSRLREFDIDEYGTFKNRRGDGLQGHEMLQNAWLEHHGYASRRLRGVASRKNPAVALSKKLHEEVYEEQRKLGLLDKHRLKRMSAEENIELNAEAMRRVGKIPEQVIQALRRKALEHASRLSPLTPSSVSPSVLVMDQAKAAHAWEVGLPWASCRPILARAWNTS